MRKHSCTKEDINKLMCDWEIEEMTYAYVYHVFKICMSNNEKDLCGECVKKHKRGFTL